MISAHSSEVYTSSVVSPLSSNWLSSSVIESLLTFCTSVNDRFYSLCICNQVHNGWTSSCSCICWLHSLPATTSFCQEIHSRSKMRDTWNWIKYLSLYEMRPHSWGYWLDTVLRSAEWLGIILSYVSLSNAAKVRAIFFTFDKQSLQLLPQTAKLYSYRFTHRFRTESLSAI